MALRLSVVFSILISVACGKISVGIIRNASLTIAQGNSTLINGTCQSCLCALLRNPSLFSFNCYSNNLTCEMHSKTDQSKLYAMVASNASTCYFMALPYQHKETSTSSFIAAATTSSTVTGSPLATVEYLWTFDSTFQDISTTFSAAPMNNATFSSTSITGYGSSLSLSSSAQQSVNISSPPLKLFNQSWTFEAWIYLANTSATNPSEYSIIGQCNSLRKDECLHLVVRNQTLHLGYYSDDLRGASKLSASRWHHVAFVFDCATRNQSVYLDGFIDGSREATVCFQGHAQSLTIGAIEAWSQGSLFDGLIDQLSFTNRSKTSDEILNDATLTVYFSFDHNSTYDQGPLRINGSLIGNVTFTAGRIGQALEIPNVNQSYIQVPGLVLLGTSDRSYSFSIWIQPYLKQQAAIVQVGDVLDASRWYLPLLALTKTSQLVSYSWDGQLVRVAGPVASANDWTHVAVTYSLTNGLRLFVNGTLIDASIPFSFLFSGTPIYLLLGNPDLADVCSLTFDSCGPYVGAVDEFRLYSRELTPADVVVLANP